MMVNKQTTEVVQFESGCSNRGQFGVGFNLPLIAFQFGSGGTVDTKIESKNPSGRPTIHTG